MNWKVATKKPWRHSERGRRYIDKYGDLVILMRDESECDGSIPYMAHEMELQKTKPLPEPKWIKDCLWVKVKENMVQYKRRRWGQRAS